MPLLKSPLFLIGSLMLLRLKPCKRLIWKRAKRQYISKKNYLKRYISIKQYWSALFARGMLADSGLSANICWWMNHQHIVGRKTLLNVAADRQPWALVNFSEYQDFLDTPRCARCRSSLRELLQLGDWRTRRYVVPSALPGAYWIWGASNWQEHRLIGRI